MANAQARAMFLTEGMIGGFSEKCVGIFYSDDDVTSNECTVWLLSV